MWKPEIQNSWWTVTDAYMFDMLAHHYVLPSRLQPLCALLRADARLVLVLCKAVPHVYRAFPAAQCLLLWASKVPDERVVRVMAMMPPGTEQAAIDGLWAFDANWWLDHYQETTIPVAFDYEMLPEHSYLRLMQTSSNG